MSNWISVKDRLPEKNQEVLAASQYRITTECNLSTNMYVAWIDSFGLENKPIWVYSECCGCHPSSAITHWIPLPELPE